jgi:maltooligosyltrehalose trehalohydrolase
MSLENAQCISIGQGHRSLFMDHVTFTFEIADGFQFAQSSQEDQRFVSTTVQRRLPIGAEPAGGGVHFRVWAPDRTSVEVVIENERAFSLVYEDNGYFSAVIESARSGMRYRFRLDHGDRLFPDPASRFQPEGPHGPSQIVSPAGYRWKDDAWPGVLIRNQVIYEMHIGTFTLEGTWNAAREMLPQLAELGITLLEVMPVADFPGNFGWGYDGVDLFAPTRLYGTPDDFRAFVDRAHALGLGVLLDVVYNHLGPDGNYLKEFSPAYFTNRYANEWGDAINFDGEGSEGVREFFVSNAFYWIDEFHLDGLRLDATQQIFDTSPEHILAVINRESRRAAGRRRIILIAENERQLSHMVRSHETGGYGLDALWNDDFHHTARVALTGNTEAYYSDYRGSPQEFISAVKWGFLYQGQYFTWQRQRRGTFALDVPPFAFVTYLQNHDQIANSARGARPVQLSSAGRYRALTALLLLGPNTPMLFQGQEYGASTPFLYFSDHKKNLAALVQQGRAEFLWQFPTIAHSQSEFVMGIPQDRATFDRCKLDPDERDINTDWVALHKDLLKLRREDRVFSAQRSDWIHGAVLGPEAFVLRFLGESDGDRLLIVNLGRNLHFRPAPEPLLAPPPGAQWEVLWSSEDLRYGGSGSPPMRKTGSWNIQAECAVVMW